MSLNKLIFELMGKYAENYKDCDTDKQRIKTDDYVNELINDYVKTPKGRVYCRQLYEKLKK